MDSKIKILIACHKPGPVYHDEVYTPIHVGRAISKCKEEMGDMIGDDSEGGNISEKNPMYCELTAQYWAWKNMRDVEYIGFCHYRRCFKIKHDSDIVNALSHKDVVTLKAVYYMPLYWEIIKYVGLDDFTILLMVIKKKYPEYEQTVINYLRGNVLYPKNMFICRWELFGQYATWLFDVLFECEKHIKSTSYTRSRRSLAYMGEYLLPVFLKHHHCRIKVDEGEDNLYRKYRHVVGLYLRNVTHFLILRIVKKQKKIEDFYDPAVLVGFRNDGIMI